MGFFGFMRAGEFTITHTNGFDPASSLCMGDIAVDYGILVVSKLLTEVLGHNFLGAIIFWAMA